MVRAGPNPTAAIAGDEATGAARSSTDLTGEREPADNHVRNGKSGT